MITRRKDWRRDPKLLKQFRYGPCEWCGRPTRTEPHHLICRGMAGGRRLDVRLNLIGLCLLCHRRVHSGDILRASFEAIVARREGCLQGDLRAAVRLLLTLPASPLRASALVPGLVEGVSGNVRNLVAKAIEEAGLSQ